MAITKTLTARLQRSSSHNKSERLSPLFIIKGRASFDRFFNQLARRDQLALLFLAGFLVIFGLGFGGWSLHEKAQKMQKEYDTAVADLFWLRSQAGNISPTQAQTLPAIETVKQILVQAGITAQVVETAGKIQLSFSHSQAGVISNVMGQLAQQGFTIEQLQINQPVVNKLEVQAVVSK